MFFRGTLVGLSIVIFCITSAGTLCAAESSATFIDKLLMVQLGKLLYEDPDLSFNGNQSCMSCHHPNASFSDPVNRISPMYRPVSEGSTAGLFGGRNAPPAAYARYSPVFHYDPDEQLFFGGLFWDGRATGRMDITATGDLGAGPTGDPLADQAKGPFGNPVEMGLIAADDPENRTTEEQVVALVRSSPNKRLFKRVFGPKAFKDPDTAYNNIALAISAFEKSILVNRFNSTFDRFRKEQGGDVSGFVEVSPGFKSRVYTKEQAEGLALFNGKGQCALCHPTGALDAKTPPVFTDFSYDNLGIPANPKIAELAGPQMIDYGLGAQVDQLEAAFGGDLNPMDADDGLGGTVRVVPAEVGKFKVSSLRNIARTAPYGHNGFFPTLYDIVHFYNTRDVLEWPAPEVSETVNDAELGNLGLTFEEEQKIVVFLETLTDNG
jgi:cytochrome c peroxidase